MKNRLLPIIFLFIITSLCHAQNPTFWGMTPYGGTGGEGIIFNYENSTETDTHNFGTGNDGQLPFGSLMRANNGLIYGVTSFGGFNDKGMIFSYNISTGIETDLHDFGSGTDGHEPTGSLIQASNGLLYGLTELGGVNNKGIIFSYNISTGAEIDLYDFGSGTDGENPVSALFQASNGLLYGTTLNAGYWGFGMFFSYDISSGNYIDIHDFGNGKDGQYPYGALIQVNDSLLYATTEFGGLHGNGTVFWYNISNNFYNTAYNFNTGTDGQTPYGSFVQANDSVLYAMTYAGGTNSKGTIFSYNIIKGTESVQYDFGSGTDGQSPYGSLILAGNGLYYGMTYAGGTNNVGTIFSYDNSTGIESDIHDFGSGTDGEKPSGNLIEFDTSAISVIALKASICDGDSTMLVASGATSYVWTPSAGLSATTGDTVVANPTVTTTYTITGKTNGSTAIATVTVMVIPSPSLTMNTPLPICNGESTTLKISGGITYTWTPATGLNITTGDSVVANPTVTTIYFVTGTSSFGCVSTEPDTVKVVLASPFIITPQAPSVCPGLNATLIAPLSGSGYSWSPSSTLDPSTGDTVVATPTATTTYTVTGTDSLGCISSGSDVVSISQAPNKPNITVSGNDLISSATQGNQWVRNDTVINGATNQTYVVTKGGYYQVIASNPANGCSTNSDSSFATGINQLTVESGQVTVYPNPASGGVIVSISSSAIDLIDWKLQITDVLGRTVYTQLSLNYNNYISVSNLPCGIYFISLINRTGRTIVPVVKQ